MAISHQLPCWESVLDDLDKVMASFPCINFPCCKSERFFPVAYWPSCFQPQFLALFCFGDWSSRTDATQKCAACRDFQRIGGGFCLRMGCFIRIYAVNVWIRKCLSLWLSQISGHFFFFFNPHIKLRLTKLQKGVCVPQCLLETENHASLLFLFVFLNKNGSMKWISN